MSRMTNREVSKKLAVVLTERMRPELMTCEDVVSTGRYPYTGTLGILSAEDKEKVKSAMEMVHAWDLKDRDFTAISDGQRQRILLARAICQEPEIIILDEPTSFLDIRHKLELLAILKKMVLEKQMTVIMSLHELDLAQKISDQVICVHGDHIEKYGAPEEIFTSDYIRKLYGITRGSYNAEFGCVEMEPPAGKPEVFVIGGNGSGIPVYRKLQRQGIPFVTGVLHTNDADYQVAKELGEPEEFCHDLAVAGMLHDIGKEAVSGDLDDMDAPLIVEEIHYVRLHAQASYEILKKEGYKETILLAVRHHHENYDGSGYPDNLSGEAIPLGARIIRVCDVYAALTSDRPYRQAFESQSAVQLMIEEIKDFDVKVFLAFQRMIHKNKEKEITLWH